MKLRPLLLLILALPALATTADRAAPVPPIIIDVPEATAGLPDLSCAQALENAKAAKAGREPVVLESVAKATATPSSPPDIKPDFAQMDTIEVDQQKTVVADLPGGRPDQLPLQPLEGTPEDLAKVGAVLARADAGQAVRMSFFGASHTGGDWWTGHLRRALQSRYGDLGHGFIWPAALYRGYRGQDTNLCRTDDWFVDWAGKKKGRNDGLYGFGGASVSSNDPTDFGWIEVTHSNPQGRKVSQYQIFTLGHPDGGNLLAQIDDTTPIALNTHSQAVELKRHILTVPDGPHRLTLRPQGDGEVRIFGVSPERTGPGVIVDAIGIRGRTARTWLKWEPDMAAAGIASLAPDLVVLAYGTNEANDLRYEMDDYADDLRGVLGLMRRGAPDAACILVGPSDRGKELSKGRYAIWDRTVPVAQVQREVAPEFGCVFWDWQAATGGAGSMIGWRLHAPPLAASDLIHFSKAGYERSADMLLSAMEATK